MKESPLTKQSFVPVDLASSVGVVEYTKCQTEDFICPTKTDNLTCVNTA